MLDRFLSVFRRKRHVGPQPVDITLTQSASCSEAPHSPNPTTTTLVPEEVEKISTAPEQRANANTNTNKNAPASQLTSQLGTAMMTVSRRASPGASMMSTGDGGLTRGRVIDNSSRSIASAQSCNLGVANLTASQGSVWYKRKPSIISWPMAKMTRRGSNSSAASNSDVRYKRRASSVSVGPDFRPHDFRVREGMADVDNCVEEELLKASVTSSRTSCRRVSVQSNSRLSPSRGVSLLLEANQKLGFYGSGTERLFQTSLSGSVHAPNSSSSVSVHTSHGLKKSGLRRNSGYATGRSPQGPRSDSRRNSGYVLSPQGLRREDSRTSAKTETQANSPRIGSITSDSPNSGHSPPIPWLSESSIACAEKHRDLLEKMHLMRRSTDPVMGSQSVLVQEGAYKSMASLRASALSIQRDP